MQFLSSSTVQTWKKKNREKCRINKSTPSKRKHSKEQSSEHKIMAAQSQICWAFYSPNFHSHHHPHHHRTRSFLTMAASPNATTSLRLRRRTASCHATASTESAETPPSPPAPDQVFSLVCVGIFSLLFLLFGK